MAYQNQGGTPVKYDLSTDQITDLKAYVNANLSGHTAQEVANVLNAQRSVDNPAPVPSIPVASVPKSNVQAMLLTVVTGLMSAASPDAALITRWRYIQDQVNAMALTDFRPADLAQWIDGALADHVIDAGQAAALTTMPDTSHPATVAAGPLAFELFPGLRLWIEASDVEAALNA